VLSKTVPSKTEPSKTEPPKTVIAFDFGTKNIGAAVGNSMLKSAEPAGIFKARDGIPQWQELIDLIERWQADLIVVGLPFNMDGSESEMSLRAKKFGNRLHGRSGKQVAFIDERLTSNEAKAIASQSGHKGNYGQAPIDELAASLILEDWWRFSADT